MYGSELSIDVRTTDVDNFSTGGCPHRQRCTTSSRLMKGETAAVRHQLDAPYQCLFGKKSSGSMRGSCSSLWAGALPIGLGHGDLDAAAPEMAWRRRPVSRRESTSMGSATARWAYELRDDGVADTPAPAQAIQKCLAGEGLLTHVVVSKMRR
jgi:hypothetical protein